MDGTGHLVLAPIYQIHLVCGHKAATMNAARQTQRAADNEAVEGGQKLGNKPLQKPWQSSIHPTDRSSIP